MKIFNSHLSLVPFMLLSSCQHQKNDNDTYLPPNIVVILADDMGYGDLSSYGATGFSTPNLDKLAMEGIRFTNFYVSQPVCSASRASLLTGCYSNRIGIKYALGPGSKIGLNPEEETIAEILRERGYKSMAIGKWHLGDDVSFLPMQQGFDDYLGLPYSNDMWPVGYDGKPKEKSKHPELPLIRGNESVKKIRTLDEQAELTSLYTKEAVTFIEKNKKHPFFLYLAHSMPHVPLAVSSKFKGKTKQGLYGDVIMELDWSVGEIIKTLEKLGIRENTLVIFTSDNGPWLSFGNHAGSAGGLREGKLTSFEGGVRVPCIMSWTREIPKGILSNKLASTIDILPTLARITGASLPEKKIDGIDISAIMKGDVDATPRRVLYHYFADNQLEAIRMDDWKLIFPHNYKSYENAEQGNNGYPGIYNSLTTARKLFNLENDPGERYDVSGLYPEVIDEIERIAQEAREDLGDSRTGDVGKNRREPGRLSPK